MFLVAEGSAYIIEINRIVEIDFLLKYLTHESPYLSNNCKMRSQYSEQNRDEQNKVVDDADLTMWMRVGGGLVKLIIIIIRKFVLFFRIE